MSERDLGFMQMILERPHGIILVTGPTGSGKTTTLYAALSQINDIQRKIITIEDPIEYQLHGVNQIQISRKAGLTFASGLRSILRHDPDVVLIGEIRDSETAEIAIQASLTGHLVFSTLHTNDAPSAMTRLVDMDIEPYLVASSLEAVLAQRLVRVVCPECREPLTTSEVMPLRKRFGDQLPGALYRGRGCQRCQGTGYRGRIGIFELMLITDEVRALILENASAPELRKVAARQGMRSLRDDGFRHLGSGRTTVEEILRVTKDDSFDTSGLLGAEQAKEQA
jgi:type II secretory ATPase GspE/PulE/Tfp pilus assembly ATPase PilB-like protein